VIDNNIKTIVINIYLLFDSKKVKVERITDWYVVHVWYLLLITYEIEIPVHYYNWLRCSWLCCKQYCSVNSDVKQGHTKESKTKYQRLRLMPRL